jgi:hypothetical protein
VHRPLDILRSGLGIFRCHGDELHATSDGERRIAGGVPDERQAAWTLTANISPHTCANASQLTSGTDESRHC